jgi:HSP20 family protein
MALRPPRAGISVARRMSERARAEREAAQPEAETRGGGTEKAGQGIGGILGALRGVMQQFADTARQQQDSFSKTVELGGENARMVFGYTLKMGPDGVAAEPFGNVPAPQDSPQAAPAQQPITEIFEDGDTVVVVAELPGADPGGITCRPEGKTLLIEATGARRYRKDLKLPASVRAEGLSQTYRNGILEVRMTKAPSA